MYYNKGGHSFSRDSELWLCACNMFVCLLLNKYVSKLITLIYWLINELWLLNIMVACTLHLLLNSYGQLLVHLFIDETWVLDIHHGSLRRNRSIHILCWCLLALSGLGLLILCNAIWTFQFSTALYNVFLAQAIVNLCHSIYWGGATPSHINSLESIQVSLFMQATVYFFSCPQSPLIHILISGR